MIDMWSLSRQCFFGQWRRDGQVSSASDCVVKLCHCSQLMVKLEPCFLCLCQEEESSGGCIFFIFIFNFWCS